MIEQNKIESIEEIIRRLEATSFSVEKKDDYIKSLMRIIAGFDQVEFTRSARTGNRVQLIELFDWESSIKGYHYWTRLHDAIGWIDDEDYR